jgi:hypothetical protein
VTSQRGDAFSSGRTWSLIWGVVCALCGLACVVLHPVVMGLLLAADGEIDSKTALSILRVGSSVAGVFCVVSLVLAQARIRQPLVRWAQRNRQRLLQGGLLGTVLAFVFGGLLTWRWNQVDVLGALNDTHAITAQVRQTAASSGTLAAETALAEYFQRRPPLRRFNRPALMWSFSGEEVLQTTEKVLQGTIKLPSGDYSWLPGKQIRWWKTDSESNMFWLHRQAVLLDLCEARRLGASTEVLDFGAAYVSEWQRGNPVWPRLSPHAWNDDTSANRIMGQIQLMKYRRAAKLTSLEEELAHLRTVIVHGHELMREEHHNFTTNHGMMQNAALLTLAAEYPELDSGLLWRDTAVKRMREHLDRHVSDAGVFLELTTGYHDYATRVFMWFLRRTEEMGLPMDEAYQAKVRKMVAFMNAVRLPDGSYPEISDTNSDYFPSSMPNWPWEDLPQWSELETLRAAAAEERGSLERTARLWPDSGYFLYREPDTVSGGPLAAVMMVGQASVAHFQPDKLSLHLFGNGRHLLTGPGAQPYSTRPASVATPQHTALSVDGLSQPAGAVDVLIQELPAPGADAGKMVLQGRSKLYDGVEHRRTVLAGPEPGSVLVVDEATSEGLHDYGLHLRAAEGLQVSRLPTGARWLDEDQAQVLELKLWRAESGGPAPVPLEVADNQFQATASHRGERVTWVWLLQTHMSQDADLVETLDIRDGAIHWSGRKGALSVGLPVSAETIEWAPSEAAPPIDEPLTPAGE